MVINSAPKIFASPQTAPVPFKPHSNPGTFQRNAIKIYGNSFALNQHPKCHIKAVNFKQFDFMKPQPKSLRKPHRNLPTYRNRDEQKKNTCFQPLAKFKNMPSRKVCHGSLVLSRSVLPATHIICTQETQSLILNCWS